MVDPFSAMHTAIFDGLGTDATYTPAGGGSAIGTRAIVDKNLQRWGDSVEVGSATAVVSLPRADVITRPRRGSSIVIGSTTYLVEQTVGSDEHIHQCLAVSA